MQGEHDVVPAVEYFPTLHSEQDEAPETEYVPAPHTCLLRAPPGQKCPAGHSAPEADEDPGGQKLPARAPHVPLHVELPFEAEKVPAGHKVHVVLALCAETVPAAHSLHLEPPLKAENVPVEQRLHEVDPSTGENVPGWQEVQLAVTPPPTPVALKEPTGQGGSGQFWLKKFENSPSVIAPL